MLRVPEQHRMIGYGSVGRLAAAILLLTLPGLPTRASADESRIEKYPDGAKKYVYSVDVDGKRHGDFNAFYADGKRMGQCRYVHGKLVGPVKGYHPNGKIKLRATYREGLRTGNLPLIDAGLEILLPSYSMLMNYTLLGLVMCLIPGVPPLAWVLCGGAFLLQIAEFALGMWVMGASLRVVASIAVAPVFLVWKMGIGVLAVVGFRRDRWVRTDRRDRS